MRIRFVGTGQSSPQGLSNPITRLPCSAIIEHDSYRIAIDCPSASLSKILGYSPNALIFTSVSPDRYSAFEALSETSIPLYIPEHCLTMWGSNVADSISVRRPTTFSRIKLGPFLITYTPAQSSFMYPNAALVIRCGEEKIVYAPEFNTLASPSVLENSDLFVADGTLLTNPTGAWAMFQKPILESRHANIKEISVIARRYGVRHTILVNSRQDVSHSHAIESASEIDLNLDIAEDGQVIELQEKSYVRVTMLDDPLKYSPLSLPTRVLRDDLRIIEAWYLEPVDSIPRYSKSSLRTLYESAISVMRERGVTQKRNASLHPDLTEILERLSNASIIPVEEVGLITSLSNRGLPFVYIHNYISLVGSVIPTDFPTSHTLDTLTPGDIDFLIRVDPSIGDFASEDAVLSMIRCKKAVHFLYDTRGPNFSHIPIFDLFCVPYHWITRISDPLRTPIGTFSEIAIDDEFVFCGQSTSDRVFVTRDSMKNPGAELKIKRLFGDLPSRFTYNPKALIRPGEERMFSSFLVPKQDLSLVRVAEIEYEQLCPKERIF